METVVAAVDEAAHELRLVAEVLALLEKQSFRAPLLVELRASLDTEHAPPFRAPGAAGARDGLSRFAREHFRQADGAIRSVDAILGDSG